MPQLDQECDGSDHDMSLAHIVIENVETEDGEGALRLCHYGMDPEEALVILKHVTTLLHRDLVAYYAERN